MQNIPSWLIKTIGLLLAIFLVIVCIDYIFVIMAWSHPTTSSAHTMSITATAKVSATPDLITIIGGVDDTGATAAEVQTKITDKMNAIIDFVKSSGVEDKDIQSNGPNVYPQYDYRKSPQVITNYTGTTTVTIKAHSADVAKKIIAGLPDKGANQIQSVSYSFQDIDTFREQAREQALRNAHDKAEALAKAAGATLGKLVTFSESGPSSIPPLPMMLDNQSGMGMGGAGMKATPPPQIEQGSQDISADVNVTYEIR